MKAERAPAGERRGALTALATRLDADAAGARDGAKLKLLVTAVRDLLQ